MVNVKLMLLKVMQLGLYRDVLNRPGTASSRRTRFGKSGEPRRQRTAGAYEPPVSSMVVIPGMLAAKGCSTV